MVSHDVAVGHGFSSDRPRSARVAVAPGRRVVDEEPPWP